MLKHYQIETHFKETLWNYRTYLKSFVALVIFVKEDAHLLQKFTTAMGLKI